MSLLDFLRTPTAQIVIWMAVLAMLLVVAFYVVRSFRSRIDDDHEPSADLLTNFREMHQRGDISDAEYRKIKTVLKARLHQELRDSDQSG